jgi:hypothetical protein
MIHDVTHHAVSDHTGSSSGVLLQIIWVKYLTRYSRLVFKTRVRRLRLTVAEDVSVLDSLIMPEVLAALSAAHYSDTWGSQGSRMLSVLNSASVTASYLKLSCVSMAVSVKCCQVVTDGLAPLKACTIVAFRSSMVSLLQH